MIQRSMDADSDFTLRYMERFRCIGPECEDNCCYGWSVMVDGPHYKKLETAASLTSKAERQRFSNAMTEVPGRHKLHAIRLKPDGDCPMLEPSGMCHVQATWGEDYLPDVCATYPRGLRWVGEHMQLAGMISCPEVARQILLHDDAVDLVPLDRTKLPRLDLAGSMDPRDIRPYWRLLLEVRTLLLQLLRRSEFTLEQRLFFMTWFAKRTMSVLNRQTMHGDVDLVRKEMASLDEPGVLDEIGRRFNQLDAPATLVLMLARALVAEQGRGNREKFRDMALGMFDSYVQRGSENAGRSGGTEITSDEFWTEYRRRRARVTERAQARVDQFLANSAANYCVHHLPIEAPDLLTYLLRMLCQMAVHKFLLFSHTGLQAALDEPGDGWKAVLDAAAVEVFYRTARHIEHSGLLANLEHALAASDMKSIAGAVYLVRF